MCVFIPTLPTLYRVLQHMPDWTVSSVLISSNLPAFPSTLLLCCIWSTHFFLKIKIYSICNKNIESAHLRTSSHLKTVEHISNNKNSYDTSGTSQPPGRLRKGMRPLFIFCFKCLKKVPEIPGSTCFYLIKWEHRSLGGLGKGNSQCESFGLVCVLNKSYKTKSEKEGRGRWGRHL